MANVTFAAFTPSLNPDSMTPVEKDKLTAHKMTYGGTVYFSWPASIVGKVINIEYDFLPANEYKSIYDIYLADNEFTFNPNDGQGKTYTAQILSMNSVYLRGLDYNSTSYRKDVSIQLLIIAEVV